jgi:hypothetical protein
MAQESERGGGSAPPAYHLELICECVLTVHPDSCLMVLVMYCWRYGAGAPGLGSSYYI